MARVIQVKQNTKEWREWRDRGLGASDAPVVMGESPWTSRFELWAYKTGLMTRPAPNQYQVAAMQRGHDLEPEARRLYETTVGNKFPSTSFEHEHHPFLRASLDGFNAKLNKNVEIKCPGKEDHAKAVAGVVPSKYMPQVQMQMLVSGAESSDYFSWNGKDSHALIEVLPDSDYQAILLQEMCHFWSLITTKIPPPVDGEELSTVIKVVQKDLDRVTQSFKALSLVCGAFIKGEAE